MGVDVTRSRKRQLSFWTSLALIQGTFLTGPNSEAAQPAEKSPPPLDLSDYKITFEDDFNIMDIVADGGNGRWFAPIHSPVGGARFLVPGRNGPFFLKNGFLTIRAENKDGRWQSGFMQSVDSKGRGFAQQYGYFEIRAKFPAGKATWPQFWLASHNTYLVPSWPRGEIDIVEAYGDQPNVVHNSVHLRLTGRNWFVSKQYRIPAGMDMAADFHRYGALVDPVWIVYYFDGQEIYRFPTLEQYRSPFYILVGLAMREKNEAAQSPSDMVIDYIRAYARK